MPKKITYAIKQLWYQITGPVAAWMEWQDAKYWAKSYHPGWLHVVRKCKHKATQADYKAKILAAYRGEDDV